MQRLHSRDDLMKDSRFLAAGEIDRRELFQYLAGHRLPSSRATFTILTVPNVRPCVWPMTAASFTYLRPVDLRNLNVQVRKLSLERKPATRRHIRFYEFTASWFTKSRRRGEEALCSGRGIACLKIRDIFKVFGRASVYVRSEKFRGSFRRIGIFIGKRRWGERSSNHLV